MENYIINWQLIGLIAGSILFLSFIGVCIFVVYRTSSVDHYTSYYTSNSSEDLTKVIDKLEEGFNSIEYSIVMTGKSNEELLDELKNLSKIHQSNLIEELRLDSQQFSLLKDLAHEWKLRGVEFPSGKCFYLVLNLNKLEMEVKQSSTQALNPYPFNDRAVAKEVASRLNEYYYGK